MAHTKTDKKISKHLLMDLKITQTLTLDKQTSFKILNFFYPPSNLLCIIIISTDFFFFLLHAKMQGFS